MAQKPDVLGRQEYWDWRPLARLIAWILLAAIFQRCGYAEPLAFLARACRQLALLWLLSFGVLTHLLMVAAMGALQAVMWLDDVSYALSERLVQPFVGAGAFAATFLAALVVQVFLILGPAYLWRSAHMGPRLLGLLAEALR